MLDMDRVTRTKKPNISRLAVILLAFLLFFVTLIIFSAYPRPTQLPVATTRFIEDPQPTSEPSPTDWVVYTSTTPFYSFQYPTFWSRASSIPPSIENCGGPVFFTESTRSWMTVCAVNYPDGMQGIKNLWLGKTDIVDRFIGGRVGIKFEYKDTTDRYEYYAVVDLGDNTNLLQFHAITDVGERSAVKSVFEKILKSLSFVQ